MTRTTIIGILLVLMVALAACGGEADAPTGITDTAPTLDEDYPDALPVSLQLSLGTLMLKETPQAVTAEQAQELLPLWQMLRALQQSDASSQVEIEAVLNQIQAAMTPEQLAAIEEMDLTPANMRAMVQELGLGIGRGEGSSSSMEGRTGPPPGVVPGSGGGRSGVPGVTGPGDGTDLSPEERATRQAERMSSAIGTALMDRLVELLEAQAGE